MNRLTRPLPSNNRVFSVFATIVSLAAVVALFNYALSAPPSYDEEINRLKHENILLGGKIYEQQKKIDIYLEEEKKQANAVCSNFTKPTRTTSELERIKEVNFRKLLVNYFQLARDIDAGNLPPRYVQCVLINGWGNILQEAIACFLFAFASNRAVIFNTGPVEGYMPFQDYLSASKLPFNGYDRTPLTKYQETVIPRFNLTCLDFDTVKDKEIITVHYTYDWFAPNVLINPYHGEQLMEILPANYFQIIFEYLFRPRDDIMADIEKFKRERFGPYMIAIQIRSPTVDHKGEKDHKGFPVPPLELYAQAAEQLSRTQNVVPYEQVRWFVATQNQDYIQRLQDAYGRDKIVAINGTVKTTFDPDKEGQRVSLTTFWLMGECDDIITTEASTYGTVAGVRTGKFPVVCNHQKFCHRRLSQTPCQDTPFLIEQPEKCLITTRKKMHQWFSSPENSCGYFKYQIYMSPEYANDKWNIKGLS